MSHEDTASVWSVLYGRQDIDNILRELIGHFRLDATLGRSDPTHVEEATFAHVLTLKVIFDLQRTYLQSSTQSTDCKLSLLRPESLLLAFLHLLDVIATGISSEAGLSVAEKTLISGLRALLLLNGSLSAQEHKLLRRRFDDLYKHEKWKTRDNAFVKTLCRYMIKALQAGQDDTYSRPACGNVELPDLFSCPYDFQARKGSIVELLQRLERFSFDSQNSFRDCLILFDLQWCTIVAMILLCLMQNDRKEERQRLAPSEDEKQVNELRQILTTRSKIIEYVSVASGEEDEKAPGRGDLTSLIDHGLHTACAEGRCKCFDYLSLSLCDLHSQGEQNQSPSTVRRTSSQESRTADVDNALRDLHSYLEQRQRSIQTVKPRCKLQTVKVDHSLPAIASHVRSEVPLFQRASTTPVTEGSWKSGNSRPPRPPLTDYKSAPDLGNLETFPGIQRPITEKLYIPVESRTPSVMVNAGSDRRSSITATNSSAQETTGTGDVLSNRSPLQSSATSLNPQYSSIDPNNFPEVYRIDGEGEKEFQQPQIKHSASVNLPERRRSSSFRSSREARQPAQMLAPDLESFPEVASSRIDVLSGAPSVISDGSDRTGALFNPDLSSAKPKKLRGFFKSSRVTATSSTPAAVLFTSGKNLLLWNERGAGYYILENLRSIPFQKLTSSAVFIGAGGAVKTAIVTKATTNYKLEVYEGPTDVRICSWKMSEVPCALAISPGDNFIAAKFPSQVNIYDIASGGYFSHQLPPVHNKQSLHHLVTFATDSLSFAASTRYEPEKVITYWAECRSTSKVAYTENPVPTGYPSDAGLTTLILSKSSARTAFLTTFTEKGAPTFLSLAASRTTARPIRDTKGRIGTRIHGAALDPTTGSVLVMLTQRNELFCLDECFSGLRDWRRVGKVDRAKSTVRDVEVGMPGKDEVHLFWIEKGRGVLVRMGLGGGVSRPVELVVDMEVLLAG